MCTKTLVDPGHLKGSHTPVTRTPVNAASSSQPNTPVSTAETWECFFCHEKGHLIAVCPALARKRSRSSFPTKKVNALSMLLLSDLHVQPQFCSDNFAGNVKVAVRSKLPVAGFVYFGK